MNSVTQMNRMPACRPLLAADVRPDASAPAAAEERSPDGSFLSRSLMLVSAGRYAERLEPTSVRYALQAGKKPARPARINTSGKIQPS